MEEKMIPVPFGDYTDLLVLLGRVKALMAYVDSEKYSISRETIASILGFEVKPDEE